MSRLEITTPNRAQTVVEGLYKDLERRIIASPPGLCPVDMASSFLKLCQAQTCGKCVPCRIGLAQLENLIDDVLNRKATLETIDLIEKIAKVVIDSADCAIGYEAANMVLKGIVGFKSDYIEHIVNNRCICNLNQPVPCVALCPAGVDIPGYISLIAQKRYSDAVKLIRKDNPFPTACAFICEHPCEARCRRNMLDDSINIKGLKRFAVDNAGKVPIPKCSSPTGKKIAVIGGGPGGLSAAYFLALMGHKVVIYEKREKLGGMLRYGIPNYRLPIERLENDISDILSTGIEVKNNVSIGTDISLFDIENSYDAVYIAIGAHIDKKIGIDGEESTGVISAVEMLRAIGEDNPPNFSGKTVVVIGGGNVAMDAARSAIRLGAKKVCNVYRRRKVDMTALPDEIEGAIAEGCEIITLKAPLRIESDKNGNVTALFVKPQIIGKIDDSRRPRPTSSCQENQKIPCDILIVAIGQGIESNHFAESGVPVKRGVIEAMSSSGVENSPGIFAGGDCVTGPATVIRAIAAGKVAAANIDTYLGYNHIISSDVEIPSARLDDRPLCGRVNTSERDADIRKNDFELIEYGMTCEEAHQESYRCLRCDHFGYGVFKGGRINKW
ncbi:NAD(P)-binding protein [Clostridium botulinum]|uniref:FAD-dependent oxidoreductase n=1 Tax=Clostridium botulinum TaxID=1491 RepID=A0A6B4JNY0_CLOBO|nr:NAD(P)-binding protein [Clostridium botulinum]EES49846.1 pyridine nucleotide-disulphide oxidoreductase family protein [Clostridium botulinum E1 str. 'BoNT E Beluga']MBY6761955.1 FAD-dependent oxidoreductase [Clostridium botulinum]MBY6920881.1 FAD-dependent oxidoreductase [Clostridium botulinum]MCR1131370.1 NAD(P)-binding protein [Clostridium botulinum]NFJ58718.1 FAD-dependent oxidoreductase [Clostridium botulinum]